MANYTTPSTSAVTASTNHRLTSLIARLKAAMRTGARNGQLREALDKGLGLDAQNEASQKIVDAWSKGARDQGVWSIPSVIILPATAMGNAQGGYWAEGKVIYLSADLLKTGSPKRQLEVLIEELFHYYDDVTNNSDSPGDEGERAAQLLLGQKPSETAWSASAVEDDHMVIDNGSGKITIEAATVTTSSYAGTTSADSITGTTGNDTLSGNSGNDTIKGLAGNDTLRGDAGNDSILGEAGNDRLEGGLDNDTLRGGAGGDTLYGNDGADILYADSASFYSASIDSLFGGLGNDRYYIDSNDVATEAADQGSDLVVYQTTNGAARTNFQILNNIEVHVINGKATEGGYVSSNGSASTIFGSLGLDTLVGSNSNDVLDQGGGGLDSIVGGAGRDIYQIQFAGAKIGELAQDKQATTVDGSDWDIVFWLNTTSSTAYVLPKEIEEASLNPLGTTTGSITGNDWNNILRGDKGVNTLTGGLGNDTIFGGDTNQTDRVDTGTGLDVVAYTNMDQLTPQPSKTPADIMSAMSYNNQDKFAFQGFYFDGKTLDTITGFVFGIAVVSGPLAENTPTAWGTAIDNAKRGTFISTNWGTVTTALNSGYASESSIALGKGISLVYSKETGILKYYTTDDYTYGSSMNPGAAVANLSSLNPTDVLTYLDGTDFSVLTGFLRPSPSIRPTV